MPGWQSTVAGMREPDLHTARAAYDAIAPVYADKFKDTLDDRPTERALLDAEMLAIGRTRYPQVRFALSSITRLGLADGSCRGLIIRQRQLGSTIGRRRGGGRRPPPSLPGSCHRFGR
jgi:hypothetical protein